MKKLLALIFCAVMCFSLFTSCSPQENKEGDNGKINVVATIFPPYDFSRQIGRDRINLTLLLPPGAESHTYEPTPADMITMQEADVFIYVGGENDTWIREILENIDTSKMKIVRLMDCVKTVDEELVEGMEAEKESGGETEPDEHVWTSPVNAMKISKDICDALCEADPGNAPEYKSNLNNYLSDLEDLNLKFQEIVSGAERKTVVFGDRFPLRYFADEYGLTYFAAFPGCSSETEPSAKTIAFLIDKVKQEKIPVVFYIEFSNHQTADTIAQGAGVQTMLFHSCHNVSKDDLNSGATYLSLMNQNAEALEAALS